MTIKLKLCPFCGNIPRLSYYRECDGDYSVYAECTECGATGPSYRIDGEFPMENVLEAYGNVETLWNSRYDEKIKKDGIPAS